MWPVNMLDSRGPMCTLLAAVECAALLAWNPSLSLHLLRLPQQSCVSYSGMAFATPLCSPKTASSLVSVARRWTYFKLIVMSSQVPATILCLLSELIGTLIKAFGSCAMNKIQFEWPLRPSSYFFMLGICALFQGQIFLAVLLPLAMSSHFRSISQAGSTGNWLLLPTQLSPTLKNLPRGCQHAVKLPNRLLRNNARIIENTSTRAAQILESTPLATLYLLNAPFDPYLRKRWLTSCSLLLPALGKWLLF
jgi:hypothetical protein